MALDPSLRPQRKCLKRRHLVLDGTACGGLVRPSHSAPFAVGEGQAHLCLLHFPASAGSLAIPWTPVSELSPPPTSHLWSPLLPQTLDTRHQTDVGAHLTPRQPAAFLWASLPRGQPRGHLHFTSLTVARKSCWPGLVEPPRA